MCLHNYPAFYVDVAGECENKTKTEGKKIFVSYDAENMHIGNLLRTT